MMAALEYIFEWSEISAVRKKNGRIFNFLRLAWNLMCRAYRVSWKWRCPRNFRAIEISSVRKTAEFSTLSNSLEIWYLGYIGYPEHDGPKINCLRFSVFARNSLNSRKFELCPISMKIDILGLFDVANMMAALEYIFESSEISAVRKKNGRIFNFLRLAWNLICRAYRVSWKWRCPRNFRAIEISSVRKNGRIFNFIQFTWNLVLRVYRVSWARWSKNKLSEIFRFRTKFAEFAKIWTLSDFNENWYLGVIWCGEYDGGIGIYFWVERNFGRPKKNGRIFNFLRLAWNLICRAYRVSWKWWCPRNFRAIEISSVRKTAEFSTLANSLEIWYLVYIGYPEHDGATINCQRFSVFARNSLKSRKFELCPISMKIDILGLFDVANMMAALEYIFESSEISAVRKKNGRIFNFLRLAWNLICRAYRVSWKWWCPRNFRSIEISSVRKTTEFSTLSNSLEIWYLGYIGYPEHDGAKINCLRFSVFARNSLNSRKFELCPISMKIDILGLFDVANMMAALEYIFESSEISAVRKKNGRIFNFLRLAWNLICRAYRVSWKWWCPRNFRAIEISSVRKTAELSTFSDWLEIWYIGYIWYPENDGAYEIFVRSKFRPSEITAEFSTFSDCLKIW